MGRVGAMGGGGAGLGALLGYVLAVPTGGLSVGAGALIGGAVGGGAGIMAGGAMEEGAATAAQAKYNKRLAEAQAKEIEAVTGYQQKLQAEDADRTASSMEAGLGASGAVTTQGSPLMMMAKQAAQSSLDNLMIGREGYTQANQARSQAGMYGMQGKLAKRRGTTLATGTLLTGFGSIAGSLYEPSGGGNANLSKYSGEHQY